MSSSEVQEIPSEMRRLVVQSPGSGTRVDDCTVVVETVPTPAPASNEVLIKVVAAPINPSDYGGWIRGGPSSYPMPMGKEGCGIVVGHNGLLASFRCPVGTKVGFVCVDGTQGSYSEYVTAHVLAGVFPMPDDVPLADCASFFVNPYTAVGILDTAKTEANSNVIVHTAAASQLGQMLNKLAPSEGMEIINVVRREDQARLLRETCGAKHVVVTNTAEEDEWKAELKAKIADLGATCAFDAVAGGTAGALLDVLPKKGIVYSYGILAGPISNVNGLDLIYRQKQLKGWVLTNWLRKDGMIATMLRMSRASAVVNSGLNGGWSSSQFEDTTMEKAFDDIVSLLGNSATGKKLRIRFGATANE